MMGECGCGDLYLRRGRRVEGTEGVLAADVYQGCRYCNSPLAVRLYFFDEQGWQEWGDGVPMAETMEPDEFGGNDGHGWHVTLFGRDELVQAAREDEELSRVRLDDYSSLADLLSEWGLHLLKRALARREERGDE